VLVLVFVGCGSSSTRGLSSGLVLGLILGLVLRFVIESLWRLI